MIQLYVRTGVGQPRSECQGRQADGHIGRQRRQVIIRKSKDDSHIQPMVQNDASELDHGKNRARVVDALKTVERRIVENEKNGIARNSANHKADG